MLRELLITEIEIGYEFLTIYGRSHQSIIQLGKALYYKLPPELKELNRESLRHIAGDPAIFHPHGNPEELQRDPQAHIHVIYPYQPDEYDCTALLSTIEDKVLKRPNGDTVAITHIEQSLMADSDVSTEKAMSRFLLEKWLQLRTETITEIDEYYSKKRSKLKQLKENSRKAIITPPHGQD
jgi:hypothetical protein